MTLLRRRFGLVLGWLALVGFTGAGPAEQGLDLYFIDVMGGAATLIVTPEKESLLIDSGWPGFDDRDPKRIVHVLKEVAGLDHLDHLVTTHWHTDHYGGVEGLSRLVEINQFWDRGLPDPSAEDGDAKRFPDGPKAGNPLGVAYRRASEGKRKTLRAGDRLPLKGVEVRVLASGGEVVEVGGGQPYQECASAPPDHMPDPSDNAR
ncbi:MAG: ComEC/Rec2 family competence protein, partial [Isosphaeraceae bacterium]